MLAWPRCLTTLGGDTSRIAILARHAVYAQHPTPRLEQDSSPEGRESGSPPARKGSPYLPATIGGGGHSRKTVRPISRHHPIASTRTGTHYRYGAPTGDQSHPDGRQTGRVPDPPAPADGILARTGGTREERQGYHGPGPATWGVLASDSSLFLPPVPPSSRHDRGPGGETVPMTSNNKPRHDKEKTSLCTSPSLLPFAVLPSPGGVRTRKKERLWAARGKKKRKSFPCPGPQKRAWVRAAGARRGRGGCNAAGRAQLALCLSWDQWASRAAARGFVSRAG